MPDISPVQIIPPPVAPGEEWFIHHVDSDVMAPDMKPGDRVAVETGCGWAGDGIYALIDPFGGTEIRKCSALPKGVSLAATNPHYSEQFMTRDRFEAVMIGRVRFVLKSL